MTPSAPAIADRLAVEHDRPTLVVADANEHEICLGRPLAERRAT